MQPASIQSGTKWHGCIIKSVKIEGARKNLQLIHSHFSCNFSPFSAMGYLELIFLRFQGFISYIKHFCILSSCRDIVKNAKVQILKPSRKFLRSPSKYVYKYMGFHRNSIPDICNLTCVITLKRKIADVCL